MRTSSKARRILTYCLVYSAAAFRRWHSSSARCFSQRFLKLGKDRQAQRWYDHLPVRKSASGTLLLTNTPGKIVLVRWTNGPMVTWHWRMLRWGQSRAAPWRTESIVLARSRYCPCGGVVMSRFLRKQLPGLERSVQRSRDHEISDLVITLSAIVLSRDQQSPYHLIAVSHGPHVHFACAPRLSAHASRHAQSHHGYNRVTWYTNAHIWSFVAWSRPCWAKWARTLCERYRDIWRWPFFFVVVPWREEVVGTEWNTKCVPEAICVLGSKIFSYYFFLVA